MFCLDITFENISFIYFHFYIIKNIFFWGWIDHGARFRKEKKRICCKRMKKKVHFIFYYIMHIIDINLYFCIKYLNNF